MLVALAWPSLCPEEVRADPAPEASQDVGLVAMTSGALAHLRGVVSMRLGWGLTQLPAERLLLGNSWGSRRVSRGLAVVLPVSDQAGPPLC